jgi:Helix-turn-helix of DDE superfamily endonuclease/DDE superfamily endonuclease
VLFYRAALPLSSKTLNYAAGIVRRHRASIGSPWRKLNPARQALLVLAYLRKGETFAELAAGFGVGTATAWRYVNETAELLAARTPKLREAVRDAKKAGYAYVVLDGTLIAIDRVAADRPFYSGKHKRHGMNLQVIASPTGDILWVSGALPGSVHDKKAEWIWGVLRNGSRRADHPGRQGLSGQLVREDPVPGEEQARIAERGEPCPREAPRPRRKGKRPAQELADPPQAPLLPLARRATRQGHPHAGNPRSVIRMKRLTVPPPRAAPSSGEARDLQGRCLARGKLAVGRHDGLGDGKGGDTRDVKPGLPVISGRGYGQNFGLS